MYCLRNTFDNVTVQRSHVCEDTLEYFLQLGRLNQMDKIKSHLKVTFKNEPGVDQGGLVSSDSFSTLTPVEKWVIAHVLTNCS